MISLRDSKRTLELIYELRYCGSRPEAEAIARELIEIGPEAGQLLSKVSHDGWNSTLAVGLKVRVLGEVGPVGSVPFLIECLKGKHPGVRRRAAEALCRLCERAGEDAALRRGLQRRVRPAQPILRKLTGVKYVGSDLPAQPYRRALARIERLLSFDKDRELPIPHTERDGGGRNLPLTAADPGE